MLKTRSPGNFYQFYRYDLNPASSDIRKQWDMDVREIRIFLVILILMTEMIKCRFESKYVKIVHIILGIERKHT